MYSWRTAEIQRERRPGEEEVVHIGLAAWDRCPSALEPVPRLRSVFICVLLQSHDRGRNVNALVRTIPHIYISVMSWIFWRICSVSTAKTNTALLWGDTTSFKAGCVSLALERRENQSNDTTRLGHGETVEPSDEPMNYFIFTHHYKHRQAQWTDHIPVLKMDLQRKRWLSHRRISTWKGKFSF